MSRKIISVTNPVRDGLAAFLRDLSAFNQPGKPSRTIDEVKFILGEGDLVLVAAKGTVAADPCVYIDLYRVDGEKLVEHWGFMEKVPPPETRKNDNGVL
jgi:predicted SnoaL-like aldol condensation-catalyzing enzyme